MPKHPLLPDRYLGESTQTAILYALDPYMVTQRSDMANPQLKWDMPRAWQDASHLLSTARWERKVNDDILDVIEIIYQLAADTPQEVEDLYTIIAGFVAYEVIHQDSTLVFTRIEHKKGGEMRLIIPISVAEKLKKIFPEARFTGEGENAQHGDNFFQKLVKRLGL